MNGRQWQMFVMNVKEFGLWPREIGAPLRGFKSDLVRFSFHSVANWLELGNVETENQLEYFEYKLGER